MHKFLALALDKQARFGGELFGEEAHWRRHMHRHVHTHLRTYMHKHKHAYVDNTAGQLQYHQVVRASHEILISWFILGVRSPLPLGCVLGLEFANQRSFCNAKCPVMFRRGFGQFGLPMQNLPKCFHPTSASWAHRSHRSALLDVSCTVWLGCVCPPKAFLFFPSFSLLFVMPVTNLIPSKYCGRHMASSLD